MDGKPYLIKEINDVSAISEFLICRCHCGRGTLFGDIKKPFGLVLSVNVNQLHRRLLVFGKEGALDGKRTEVLVYNEESQTS